MHPAYRYQRKGEIFCILLKTKTTEVPKVQNDRVKGVAAKDFWRAPVGTLSCVISCSYFVTVYLLARV